MSVLDRIKEMKMIPVVALERVEDAKPLAKALTNGGLAAAEVTFRFPDAEKCIKAMKEECPEMLIGAGTVLTREQVDMAVEAGAEFIVSPGFNEDTVKYCNEKGITIIPGCSSPSDIEKALSLGLDTVKFFPAEANGGVKMLKALAAPYNKVKFMPTGGISIDNMDSYYALKCVIALGGSFMVSSKDIKEGNFTKIENITRKLTDRLYGKETEIKKDKIDLDKMAGRKIVTFGEIMLRLAPFGYERFLQANSYEATFGGGEANVSVSLANFGMDTSFVTKLPKHEIGQSVVNALRGVGVDTSDIVRGGDRVGIYYLEKGASQRPSKVIYDRAGSAIAKAEAKDFDWDKIFEGAGWFHFTGITPALSDELADICIEACKKAKEKGLIISADLNYRNKLWSKEKAGLVMSEICKYVDICIANEEDAACVFGIKAENTDVTSGKLNKEGYVEVARKLIERFDFSYVAITLRESLSANDNKWAAMLYDGDKAFFSKSYNVHIVDRVGGGDSFGAGLIYSFMSGKDKQEIIEFATAASCLKHSIEGDFNYVSVEEVEKLAGGDGSGRVQR